MRKGAAYRVLSTLTVNGLKLVWHHGSHSELRTSPVKSHCAPKWNQTLAERYDEDNPGETNLATSAVSEGMLIVRQAPSLL